MYTALLGCLTTPGLDGMRFALVLFKFSVFETFTESRFPSDGWTRGAISFLRQQTWQETENLVVAGMRMWESR